MWLKLIVVFWAFYPLSLVEIRASYELLWYFVDAPNVILDVGDLDKLNSKGINVEKK